MNDGGESKKERIVLTTGFETLQREFDRITFLLDETNNTPAYYKASFQGRFRGLKEAINKGLLSIKEAIDGKDDSLLQRGWHSYVKVRTELMPSLSNELLAAIGGKYIYDKKLDPIDVEFKAVGNSENDSGQEEHKAALSFSEVAQKLVEDLSKRAD